MGGISIFSWIIVLAVFVVPIWAWCTIVKKAGFSPWWGLLAIVPLVNIAMLFVFAYSRWPTDGPSGGPA
jgi:hypothetical protein